jgi:hypothetical protein
MGLSWTLSAGLLARGVYIPKFTKVLAEVAMDLDYEGVV